MRFAFKEWAVICRALAEGRQALILRKGGIAEEGNLFRPDHARFWLYPTFLHQKPDGVQNELASWFAELEANRPPKGVLRLTHYAEVTHVYRATALEPLLSLTPWHGWSIPTVQQRFHYREPGLYVLPVRVFAIPEALEVPDLPEYEGCKTWVDLGHDYPADGTPVLHDNDMATVQQALADIFAHKS